MLNEMPPYLVLYCFNTEAETSCREKLTVTVIWIYVLPWNTGGSPHQKKPCNGWAQGLFLLSAMVCLGNKAYTAKLNVLKN